MARKVTTEERRLWNQVAATTSKGAGPIPTLDHQVGGPTDNQPKSINRASIQPFTVGSRVTQTTVPKMATKQVAPIDAKALTRMRRGKLSPEDRIDLHGLTQSEALPELIGFILQSAQRNLRMVLVITGKGRGRDGDGPIPERVGVLRQNVPDWLRRPPLGAIVQGVVPAHQRHGGSGAMYVYLRRLRK